MGIINDFLKYIAPLWPTGLTLILIIICMLILRVLFRTKAIAATENKFKHQILALIVIIFGILVIVLVLPINDNVRGQLLSLIGIVISAAIALSSTTFLGNIMAGFMLRAIRNFRPGDYIRVENFFGRVSERGLFHVEIQTEDSDLTTLPNLFLVVHPVKVIRESGTLISAEVSLGYDIPRKAIEQVLLEAAEAAELSEPFVYVMDLGDFSVTYRVAGLCTDVKHVLSSKSNLRKMMMDHLQGNGIEIVSPTFMNTRAIPKGKSIMPEKSEISTTDKLDDSGSPESIVFDKAEEAQSIEKLKEELKTIEEKISEIKDNIKKSETEQEETKLKNALDKLQKKKEQIIERIKEAEKEK